MASGVTLSVCIIARDEAPVMARCLEGVRLFADEIIVVDTGSMDETKEIAARYTNRVYDFPWIDDFAAARNAAYSYAVMDYIMWLDADDVVELRDAEALNALKQTLPGETDAVYLRYGGDTDQTDIYGNTSLMRDRWVRRSLRPLWKGRLHEYIELPADMNARFEESIVIRHRKVRVNDPERNMRIHRLCMAEQQTPEVRGLGFLCREYCTQGQYEEAAAVFDELAGLTPFPAHDVENALFSYIWSLKALKRTDALIASLSLLLARGVENEMLLCELGAAYLVNKEYCEAKRYLTRALETTVNLRDLKVHFDAYHVFIPCQKLSKLYAALGETDKAYEFFLRAEAVYPDNPGIRLNRLFFAGGTR